MSLRAKAVELEQAPNRRHETNIGRLIAALETSNRVSDADEVRDLLVGEPLIAHAIVARILSDEFADVLTSPVNGKQVERWRKP